CRITASDHGRDGETIAPRYRRHLGIDTRTRIASAARCNQGLLTRPCGEFLRDRAYDRRKKISSSGATGMVLARNSHSEIDGIPGLVAVLTPEGDVEAANPQIVEYCGRSVEGLKDWGTNGIVHPEDVPRIAPPFLHAIGAGEPYDYECRIRRFDGVYRWCQV